MSDNKLTDDLVDISNQFNAAMDEIEKESEAY